MRRSSRARSLNQPASSSSTSTATLKTAQRAGTQRSESLESPTPDNESQATTEPVMPRRSRRGGNGDETAPKESLVPTAEPADELEENVEEEVTRCVCGQPDYPGPLPSLRDLATQQGIPDPMSEDLGNFFVQCDNCSIWQHAGCVGLIDEANLPEQYYCEGCRPAYHQITRGPNGIKSSRYLPVLEIKSRSSSLSSHGDPTRRKSNTSKNSESTKRRATMNSRGAYDEDEMLRRAIEESREMGTLGKRTRDDNDDARQAVKRQRTTSSSPSSGSKRSQSPSVPVEDGSRATSTKAGQKTRGAVVKSNKEKEIREKMKEQTAAMRQEAANKRNARSERRRGEDSPPPTPSLSPSKPSASMTAQSKSQADTPPASRGGPKGKTGRPARRGRLGRNQYTRDAPTNGDNSDTPMRDMSVDRNGGSPNGVNGINGESGKSSKAKTHPARTSMNEMKRRVAAILEFVGRMQTERGGTSQQTSGSASSKGANTPNGNGNGHGVGVSLPTASLVKAVQEAREEVIDADTPDGGMVKMRDDREFQVMASGEMMETLTKELVAWQSVYGTYSR